MKDNFDYEKYNDGIHLFGRISIGIGLILLYATPFAIAYVTGSSFNMQGFWQGLINVAIIYVPVGLVEFLIYVPLLGASACYLGFLTGNISNLKLPCAFNSRDIAKTEVGTPENEIISTLAVATSSLVTMLVIFLGVLMLIPLEPILQNPVIKPAFDNVLPALFGALAYQYFSKSYKLAIGPFLLMLVLCILVPSLIKQTSILLIVIGGIAIALSYFMYKKKWLI